MTIESESTESILLPRIPLKYQRDEISPILEFELPTQILSLDWSDDVLISGNSLGVTILAPEFGSQPPEEVEESTTIIPPLIGFQSTFQHLGSPALHVRAKNGYLAAAHPDFSISLVNLGSDEIIKLEGGRGHDSFINSLDIGGNGIIASTGDDRTLLVWEDAIPKSFMLGGSGKVVKFWDAIDSDRLIVLEAGNKIRVLDWRKNEWLLTIYVGGGQNEISSVKDIGVYDGEIVAIGNGWWKSYNIQALNGGCGYTPASDEGRLVGSADASLIKLNDLSTVGNKSLVRGSAIGSSSSGPKVSYITSNGIGIYDLGNAGEHGQTIDYNMGVRQFSSISINSRGDSIAVSSGRLLSLCRV